MPGVLQFASCLFLLLISLGLATPAIGVGSDGVAIGVMGDSAASVIIGEYFATPRVGHIGALPLKFGMAPETAFVKLERKGVLNKKEKSILLPLFDKTVHARLEFTPTHFVCPTTTPEAKRAFAWLVSRLNNHYGAKLAETPPSPDSKQLTVGPLGRLAAVVYTFEGPTPERVQFNEKFAEKYRRVSDEKEVSDKLGIHLPKIPLPSAGSLFETDEMYIYTRDLSRPDLAKFMIVYVDKEQLQTPLVNNVLAEVMQHPENLAFTFGGLSAGQGIYACLDRMRSGTVTFTPGTLGIGDASNSVTYLFHQDGIAGMRIEGKQVRENQADLNAKLAQHFKKIPDNNTDIAYYLGTTGKFTAYAADRGHFGENDGNRSIIVADGQLTVILTETMLEIAGKNKRQQIKAEKERQKLENERMKRFKKDMSKF